MDKGLSVSFTSRERPPKEPKKEQRSIDGSGDNFFVFWWFGRCTGHFFFFFSSVRHMALAKQLENIQTQGIYVYQRPKAPPSILFDNQVSRKLDTEQILHLAVEGLETLRNLDQRFCRFEHTIFSLLHPIDRNLKDDEENKAIDKEIREFCSLASPYFLLRATHKCLEWLIRGLEAGKRNVDDLIALALPFHATPQFVRLLSVCELEATHWVFLKPVSQHKEPLQRETLRQHAPLWLWEFVTQTAKGCAERSVRASQLYSFWAVFVREKLQVAGENDTIVMKNILLDTLAGIQMRQGDWDSLLEYRNASVVVLCSFFKCLKLNRDIVSACRNALCHSFDSVRSLQNMTQAVYSSEENKFYKLCKSLVKCLILLFFYQMDRKQQPDDYFLLSTENIACLYKEETSFERIMVQLVKEENELDSAYSYPFMMTLAISMIEQLTWSLDRSEAVYQVLSLIPTEFLRYLVRKLLECFERQLELCLKQQEEEDISNHLNDSQTVPLLLERLRQVMNRWKSIGRTEELDAGIREYLQQSKNASIREQIANILVGVFSGSLLMPLIVEDTKDEQQQEEKKEPLIETLLGGLEHPEETIRVHALKILKQHVILETIKRTQDNDAEWIREIAETLIRRIDMEDSLEVLSDVLDLFINYTELQRSVPTLLDWSMERRLERMWKQQQQQQIVMEDNNKEIILLLLQKLPLFDQQTNRIPLLLGNFISILLHPEIDGQVKQAALRSWMILWKKGCAEERSPFSVETTDSEEEEDNMHSPMVSLVTKCWLNNSHRLLTFNEWTLIISIAEKLMKDCLDILSYERERRQSWQEEMIFRQLLSVAFLLNIALLDDISPREEEQWMDKIYSLVECVVECVGSWILSYVGGKERNKPLDSLMQSAWNEPNKWREPLFLHQLFSETKNCSVLLFCSLSMLKRCYQRWNDDGRIIPMQRRTQLLASLLFTLENCKWNWSSLDRKMIRDCIDDLAPSCGCRMEENIVHLLFDNEFHYPPVWIACYLIVQENKNEFFAMAVFLVLYQQFPWARAAIKKAYKSAWRNEATESKFRNVLVDPSALSEDIKVAMLQSCLDMKYLSNFHIQLATLLAPVSAEQSISLELLETVVQLLQRWEDKSSESEQDIVQRFKLVLTPYFTFVREEQVARERNLLWDVFVHQIANATTKETRIAFLKRWPFVVSCGNEQKWKDLADILFQLWMDENQDDVVSVEAKQLLMKLAQYDVALFLTPLEQLVKDTQSATLEDLPLQISRSIPLLEIFANIDVDALKDEEDLSYLVKSLTIYLPLLSKPVESSVCSYAQGLVISILYRLCKHFGRRFPVGSLYLKIFTQDNEEEEEEQDNYSHEKTLSRSALIRLMCYLTQLFPSEMKDNFIRALKWMLKMTNAKHVVRNMSFITPAIISVLSQEHQHDSGADNDDNSAVTIPFISELLSFLDSESCLLLTTSIVEVLDPSKLHVLLFSYLLRESQRNENVSTVPLWEKPCSKLLFHFPLTIQLGVAEQFLQSADASEDRYVLSLEWLRCITQSPVFLRWHASDSQDNAFKKEEDAEENKAASLAASILSQVFIHSVKTQKRMEIFQQQYASSLVCWFPFSLVISTMKDLLKMESTAIRFLALTCVISRMEERDNDDEKHKQQHASWNVHGTNTSPLLGRKLLPDIVENVTTAQTKPLQLTSIAALDVCLKTIHSREFLSKSLLSVLSPAIHSLIQYSGAGEKKKTIATSSMLCLSTVLGKLRLSCVEYVPPILQVIATVWAQSYGIATAKRKPNGKQQNYIRAVMLLVSTFQEHLSAFWNISTVHSMMMCCTRCKNALQQQLMDQLKVVISHLRVHVAIPIWNMGLEDMSIERVHFLLCCMETWLDKISHKELRSHQHDIFDFLFKALDIRKQSTEDGLFFDHEELSRLEDKIGQIFTKQALRLTTSDFRVLFMRLVGWCEEDFSHASLLVTPHLWDPLCPFRCCYERLASLLKVVVALAQGLRELFLPCFSYVVDWCFWVASCPTLEEYWNKMENEGMKKKKKMMDSRKREWQSLVDSKQQGMHKYRKSLERRIMTDAIQAIQEYIQWTEFSSNESTASLFDSILHLLETRLEPNFPGQQNTMNNNHHHSDDRKNVTRVDADILASMTSLFAEKIAKQVSSTAEDKNSREEVDSERRLASLNRFLLIKCRERDEQVKQTSMVCVERMIQRLGHRFLSLLPETLPLLAECLEDDAIHDKTVELVRYLEDLSGEPIYKYLVK